MRTTIDLPDDLARQAKAAAALRGVKLKELLARFVEQGLLQLRAQPEARQRSKLPTFKKEAAGGSVPYLSNSEIQNILDEGGP